MKNLQPPSFALCFLILSFFVWIYRSLRLILTQIKTPSLTSGFPQNKPLVSIIIPAKNEEKNISACLTSLKNQNYPHCEILVINDNSSDQTEKILKETGIPYLNCPPPPAGWTGKTHALDYGSAHIKGDWVLFTDADTRHEPHALASALAHVESCNLDFLTLLPHCLTGSFIEEVLQPSAMAYLGLWFPFERANNARASLYFGNGQYLLMKRSLYEKLGKHKAVAKEFLEDFALMRLAKQSGAKAEVAFGTNLYGTRMYDSFSAIWRGWRRIYLHAFERNFFPLIKNALSIFFFSFLPFVLISFTFSNPGSTSNEIILSAILIAWILIVAWRAHKMVKAKGVYAIFQPFAAFVIALILLDAAGMALRNEKTLWR